MEKFADSAAILIQTELQLLNMDTATKLQVSRACSPLSCRAEHLDGTAV